MTARVDLAGLALNGGVRHPDGYTITTLGGETTFGDLVPIESVVSSLMADGELTRTKAFGNREVTVVVEVAADDSDALARGEAAIAATVGDPADLIWQPADGVGFPSVFEVQTSVMQWLFDDLDEAGGVPVLRRRFRLRLVCLPTPRSLLSSSLGSAFVPESVTVVDPCESTTGWSDGATRPAVNWLGPVTFSVDTTAANRVSGTGSIKVVSPSAENLPNDATIQVSVKKSGLSVATGSSGGYLTAQVKYLTPTATLYGIITDSTGRTTEVQTVVAARGVNGFVRCAWALPANVTVTSLTIQAILSARRIDPTIWVDEIGTTTAAPAGQGLRSVPIKGTARTYGELTLSAIAGLGDVAVCTMRDLGDGFHPGMRRWQVTGTTTADSAAINGTRTGVGFNASALATFEAPANLFRECAHVLFARVNFSANTVGSAVSLQIKTQVFAGGQAISPEQITTSDQLTKTADGYELSRVGTAYLPNVIVAKTSTAVVRFTVTSSATSDVFLDEFMAFPQDEATALTVVRCGTGSPSATVSSRLWIQAPSPATPLPRVMVGNDAGRGDARAVIPVCRARHDLYPGRILAYIISGAAGGANLGGTYFARWMHNAASLGGD